MTKSKKATSDRVIFGKNVKRARLIRGWSQEVLGVEAGVDRTFVSAVERAVSNISLDNMSRLASALSVPLRDLVDPDRFSDPLDQGGAPHARQPK